MLSTYRRALALPGAWQFSSTGFVARLPMSMTSLAIVILVSGVTGSYGWAGAISAVYAILAALGALVSSRLMDQYGQGRLLPWLATVNAVMLVVLALVVVRREPLVLAFGAAAIAGLAQPAVGSMVRARWAALAPDEERLHGAFAIESIVDEIVYTVGPLLTAVLAFQVALPSPIYAAAVIGLIGCLVLSLQRRTQPRPSGRGAHSSGSAIRTPGILFVIGIAAGLGGVFGSYEVIVPAFARAAGQPGASGLVLALWALGSMGGGIVFGARTPRMPLPRQLVLLLLVLTIVLLPAPFLASLPALTVATFISGAAVAPVLIATFSTTERLVDGALLTEGLSWTNAGIAIGFSAGATAAGWLVDEVGTSGAFALPIGSAAFGLVLAAAGQPALMRAYRARHAHPGGAIGISLVADPLPGPAPGGVLDEPE